MTSYFNIQMLLIKNVVSVYRKELTFKYIEDGKDFLDCIMKF